MLRKFVSKSTKVFKNTVAFNKPQIVNVINNKNTKRFYAKGEQNAAVLLSGCGYLDGSEVTEAVSCIVQLQKAGYKVDCFAPKLTQEETYDHQSGKIEKNEVRHVESESTRIARKLQPWGRLKADSYGLLVVPGGFGVAKNLSSFAEEGAEHFTVKKEVEDVLKDFHSKQKSIALACIAPILAARVFGKKNGGAGCKITLGTDSDLSKKIEGLGVKVEKKGVNEVCVDEENQLVTTPAYMESKATPLDVFEAVGEMINAVSSLGGIGRNVDLSDDTVKAIKNITGGDSSHSKWWAEQIQKGDKTSNLKQRYKDTINEPSNWE